MSDFTSRVEQVEYQVTTTESAIQVGLGYEAIAVALNTVSIGGIPNQVNLAAQVQEVGFNITLAAAGAPSTPEDDIMYAKRVDFVTEQVIYRGEALPGSDENDPVWRVRRITLALDNDVTEEWAGGTSTFDKRWSERATFDYI